jgi:hypothetical protein
VVPRFTMPSINDPPPIGSHCFFFFFFTPWIRHFACFVYTLHLAIFSLVFRNLSFLRVCTEVLFSVISCLAFYLYVGTSSYDIAQLYHLKDIIFSSVLIISFVTWSSFAQPLVFLRKFISELCVLVWIFLWVPKFHSHTLKLV